MSEMSKGIHLKNQVDQSNSLEKITSKRPNLESPEIKSHIFSVLGGASFLQNIS